MYACVAGRNNNKYTNILDIFPKLSPKLVRFGIRNIIMQPAKGLGIQGNNAAGKSDHC